MTDVLRLCPDCERRKLTSEFPFRKHRWISNRRCYPCQNAFVAAYRRRGRPPSDRFWTAEQDAFLILSIKAGRSAEEIAQSIGRTAMSVRKRASNLFLKWPAERKRKWTPDRLSHVARLLNIGFSQYEVARRTGETRAAISNAVRCYLVEAAQ